MRLQVSFNEATPIMLPSATNEIIGDKYPVRYKINTLSKAENMISQKRPKMSQNIPKHPEASQNVLKHSKTSQNLPKKPQYIPKNY